MERKSNHFQNNSIAHKKYHFQIVLTIFTFPSFKKTKHTSVPTTSAPRIVSAVNALTFFKENKVAELCASDVANNQI